jgi:hypothetical protein
MAGIDGTIYAPSALMYLTGDAQINAALVVNELTLAGDSSSTLTIDGGTGNVFNVTVPTGGPYAGVNNATASSPNGKPQADRFRMERTVRADKR